MHGKNTWPAEARMSGESDVPGAATESARLYNQRRDMRQNQSFCILYFACITGGRHMKGSCLWLGLGFQVGR